MTGERMMILWDFVGRWRCIDSCFLNAKGRTEKLKYF